MVICFREITAANMARMSNMSNLSHSKSSGESKISAISKCAKYISVDIELYTISNIYRMFNWTQIGCQIFDSIHLQTAWKALDFPVMFSNRWRQRQRVRTFETFSHVWGQNILRQKKFEAKKCLMQKLLHHKHLKMVVFLDFRGGDHNLCAAISCPSMYVSMVRPTHFFYTICNQWKCMQLLERFGFILCVS